MTRKTAPELVIASRPPPIAGPAKLPMLSIVLRVTLAADSSSGVRASSGRRDDSAGRNAVARIEASPARHRRARRAGRSASATAPAAPIVAARPAFVEAISTTRGIRSASVEVNGAEIADGMVRISATIPTAFAPPAL